MKLERRSELSVPVRVNGSLCSSPAYDLTVALPANVSCVDPFVEYPARGRTADGFSFQVASVGGAACQLTMACKACSKGQRGFQDNAVRALEQSSLR